MSRLRTFLKVLTFFVLQVLFLLLHYQIEDGGLYQWPHSETSLTRDSRKGSQQLPIQPSQSLDELVPPPQGWLKARMRATLDGIGLNPDHLQDWNTCKTTDYTYYFPRVGALLTTVPKAGCSNWKETFLRAEGILTKELEKISAVHGIANGNRLQRFLEAQGVNLDLLSKEKRNKYPINPDISRIGEATSVIVLRNPWTRLVSGFRDKLSDEDRPGQFKRPIGVRIVSKARGIAKPEVVENNLYPTFVEFAEWVAQNGGGSTPTSDHSTHQLATTLLPTTL